MRDDTPIFRSLEIIENRISEKLTVENIASSVYFSKFHYQRLFREIVGDSVMEYVTKRKLTLAGRALLETDMPVMDIAVAFGFDSREGFTRSFKAYMGVTPGAYRKYGLTAIEQNHIKERSVMTYSKTTDHMIRELNIFIAEAKETAQSTRKADKPQNMNEFWQFAADTAEAHANVAQNVLADISAMADHPRAIADRFKIIKVIQDIAFQFNLLAFNVGLTVSRCLPEYVEAQKPLHEKFHKLAQTAFIKTTKVRDFLNELSALIFTDMQNAFNEQIRLATEKGEAAVDGITAYPYIKKEVANVVTALAEMPPEEISVRHLEDYLFRLKVLSYAAEIDILRNPQDRAQFDGLNAFKTALINLIEFAQTLIRPEAPAVVLSESDLCFQDIAFQMNLLLFYTRGELEKMRFQRNGGVLADAQKQALDSVCEKMEASIQIAHSKGKNALNEIADNLDEIIANMVRVAEELQKDGHGAPILYIAREVKEVAERCHLLVRKNA